MLKFVQRWYCYSHVWRCTTKQAMSLMLLTPRAKRISQQLLPSKTFIVWRWGLVGERLWGRTFLWCQHTPSNLSSTTFEDSRNTLAMGSSTLIAYLPWLSIYSLLPKALIYCTCWGLLDSSQHIMMTHLSGRIQQSFLQMISIRPSGVAWKLLTVRMQWK